MTDDLRAIDRRCAELMGDGIPDPKGFGHLFINAYSRDPTAANLLIEELVRHGVYLSIDSPINEEGMNQWDACGNGAEAQGNTWMEAVARLFIAVREAEA